LGYTYIILIIDYSFITYFDTFSLHDALPIYPPAGEEGQDALEVALERHRDAVRRGRHRHELAQARDRRLDRALADLVAEHEPPELGRGHAVLAVAQHGQHLALPQRQVDLARAVLDVTPAQEPHLQRLAAAVRDRAELGVDGVAGQEQPPAGLPQLARALRRLRQGAHRVVPPARLEAAARQPHQRLGLQELQVRLLELPRRALEQLGGTVDVEVRQRHAQAERADRGLRPLRPAAERVGVLGRLARGDEVSPGDVRLDDVERVERHLLQRRAALGRREELVGLLEPAVEQVHVADRAEHGLVGGDAHLLRVDGHGPQRLAGGVELPQQHVAERQRGRRQLAPVLLPHAAAGVLVERPPGPIAAALVPAQGELVARDVERAGDDEVAGVGALRQRHRAAIEHQRRVAVPLDGQGEGARPDRDDRL